MFVVDLIMIMGPFILSDHALANLWTFHMSNTALVVDIYMACGWGLGMTELGMDGVQIQLKD